MKVTIKGFIHWKQPHYAGDEEFSFYPFEWKDSEYNGGRIVVMPHSFEVDVPDDFDPTAKQIAALEKEKAKVRKEFNARIAQLNEQIGKLQALTFDEVKS